MSKETRLVFVAVFLITALFISASFCVPVIAGDETLTLCKDQGIRGDANSDGEINLADAVYILNYLFLSGPAPECFELADFNADMAIDLADSVRLLSYLFLGEVPAGDIYFAGTDDPPELAYSFFRMNTDGTVPVPDNELEIIDLTGETDIMGCMVSVTGEGNGQDLFVSKWDETQDGFEGNNLAFEPVRISLSTPYFNLSEPTENTLFAVCWDADGNEGEREIHFTTRPEEAVSGGGAETSPEEPESGDIVPGYECKVENMTIYYKPDDDISHLGWKPPYDDSGQTTGNDNWLGYNEMAESHYTVWPFYTTHHQIGFGFYVYAKLKKGSVASLCPEHQFSQVLITTEEGFWSKTEKHHSFRMEHDPPLLSGDDIRGSDLGDMSDQLLDNTSCQEAKRAVSDGSGLIGCTPGTDTFCDDDYGEPSDFKKHFDDYITWYDNPSVKIDLLPGFKDAEYNLWAIVEDSDGQSRWMCAIEGIVLKLPDEDTPSGQAGDVEGPRDCQCMKAKKEGGKWAPDGALKPCGTL